MLASLRQRPNLVFALLAVYFAANLALRLLLPRSLDLDEGEQLFLAQWLAAGYNSQPPLYNWLQYAVVALLGPTLFSLALLKNLLLLASYLFFGLAANTVLRSRELAIIAVLGLLTIPQVSFEAQRDLSHTVAVIFATSLFLYAFLRTLKTGTTVSYLLTGLAVGLGVISKYNFVLLPAAAALAVLPEPTFRRRLFDWRILLAGLVALLVFLPHGLWFLDHVGDATGRTLGKLTSEETSGRAEQILTGLVSLVLAFIGFSALTLLPFALIFREDLKAILRARSEWTRLFARIFLISAVALVLMVLFGATNIKDRWLTPLYLALPLYLTLKAEAAGTDVSSALRRFLPVALAVMVLVPAVLFLRIPVLGMIGRYEKINVPYGPAIERILAEAPSAPALVVTSDLQMAGNIRLHRPDLPVFVPGQGPVEPVVDTARPVLVVWRTRDGRPESRQPEALASWIAGSTTFTVAETGEVAVPYHYGRTGDLYHVAFSYLVPKGD
ncbi:MAG TPA: glycosyltransferase family 39 protein [Rhizobium sp.]|nr:glycosyltransferase family 39 protein [Rhizobium sp.]